MYSIQQFCLFPLLPLELRLRILFFALPPPQLVSLVAYHEEKDVKVLNRLLDRRYPERDSDESLSETGCQRMKLIGDRCHILASKSPSPLLHANHESRLFILSQSRIFYSPDPRQALHFPDGTALASSNWKPRAAPDVTQARAPGPINGTYTSNASRKAIKRLPVLFNSKLDVLFLADPRDRSQYSSLSVIVRCFDEALLSSIRMLGVSYFTWRKDRLFKNLGELSKFQSLEKLWICFEGCGEDVIERGGVVGHGRGWLDALRQEGDDQDGRLKQVEREALEDMKEMERTLSTMGTIWSPPILSVVRDQEALVKEWKV